MKNAYNIILASGSSAISTMTYPINLNNLQAGNYNLTFAYSSNGITTFGAETSNTLLQLDLGQATTYLVFNPLSSITNISKVIGALKPVFFGTFLSFQNSPSDNPPVPIYISTGITEITVSLLNGTTMASVSGVDTYTLILHLEEI
jgi:hypothetical protein